MMFAVPEETVDDIPMLNSLLIDHPETQHWESFLIGLTSDAVLTSA
jgi:hypothetical protein